MADYETFHDANNVSNFGGDPITFLKRFKNSLRCFTGTAHHSRDAATGFVAVATRPLAGCWIMQDRRCKSLISWPYQPKHSPSSIPLIHFGTLLLRWIFHNTSHNVPFVLLSRHLPHPVIHFFLPKSLWSSSVSLAFYFSF